MAAPRRIPGLDGECLTFEQAAGVIDDGASVFLEQGACEPLGLHRALLDLNGTKNIRLLAAPVAGLNECAFGDQPYTEWLNPVVFVSAPCLALAVRSGAVDYVPMHWSEVVEAIRSRFRPDVALLRVSPPDQEGYCNLGTNAAFELEVALLAKTIIAEIDATVPAVPGDTSLHQSRIQYYVPVQYELRALPPPRWGSVEAEIARHVVGLLPPRSTLQVGHGKMPDAVMARVVETGADVRFHSGILTDGMVAVLDGASAYERPATVAGMLIGSRRVYEYANRNSRVRLRCTAFTHSLAVLAGIDRFVSINSAIEVDLLGQVNAESVNGQQVAGVGGQVDFFRGARASAGGMAILALPSQTRAGSRIVRWLQPGAPVSTSRVDVDFVVTEYGVAEMRNQTERERRESLIRIAAPQYRPELRTP